VERAVTDPNPDWTTKSVKIELDRHGGGFIALDLVAPATVTLTAGATHVVGTRFIAKVAYTAVNLPAKEIDCAIKWSIAAPKSDKGPKTIDVVAASVKLEAGSGTVDAVLDLMTAGFGFGAFLESGGGDFTLTFKPDYPHVRDATVVVPFHHKLAIHLLAKQWAPPAKPPKKPAPPPKIEPTTLSRAGAWAPLIGEVMTVTLDRSQWPCHVRLRIDTPENDVVIAYPPGKSGDQPWRFGCSSAYGLQFPKPKDGKLGFTLLLEVSESGKDEEWAAVHRAWLTVPEPQLTGLAVETAPPDRHTYATGKMSGFAPGFAPPFTIEPWVIADARPGVKGPRPMHPIGHTRSPIGVIDAAGEFRTEIASLPEGTIGKPFVVLRAPPMRDASGAEKLTPVGSYIRFKGLRAFGDEDLIDAKSVPLGIASAELVNVSASRAPVALKVSIEVVGATVTAHADVLGPASYWKDAKPSFGFHLEGAATDAASAPAKHAAVPGSASHGILTGALPFTQLGALAAKVAVVQLRITSGKDAPEGLAEAHAKVRLVPGIGPIAWALDKDKKKKDRVHFTCKTTMFPEKSELLVVTIVEKATKTPIAAKIVYENASGAGGQVDDEGLEFFITDPAHVAKVAEQLGKGELEVTVSRPVGAAKLYGEQEVAATSDLRATPP
jgi:hypothetical protein